MHVYIYIYIYIYREREREIVDFSESEQKMKISRKMDKSNTYNGFRDYNSFFIHRRSVNKERNITYKSVISV